jgi:hypothetical protein
MVTLQQKRPLEMVETRHGTTVLDLLRLRRSEQPVHVLVPQPVHQVRRQIGIAVQPSRQRPTADGIAPDSVACSREHDGSGILGVAAATGISAHFQTIKLPVDRRCLVGQLAREILTIAEKIFRLVRCCQFRLSRACATFRYAAGSARKLGTAGH